MSDRDRLIDHLATLVNELPRAWVGLLAAEVSRSSPGPITTVADRAAPESVKELGALWIAAADVTSAELAIALQTAARAVKTATAYEKVEMLWTGPTSKVPFRRTEQALLEVIRSARETLWIVSFVVVDVDEVLEAIAERSTAGVATRLVLDHRPDTAHRAINRVRRDAPDCQVLVWPDELRELDGGGFATLHAKCAVADGRQAFVSSANLTGRALAHNMELGYLVTGGPTPRRLEDHLDSLLLDSILKLTVD